MAELPSETKCNPLHENDIQHIVRSEDNARQSRRSLRDEGRSRRSGGEHFSKSQGKSDLDVLAKRFIFIIMLIIVLLYGLPII